MVEEFARHRKQWKVVVPGVCKEFNCLRVDLKSKCFEEGNERVDQLLVVEVELKRDELVQERMA